MGQIQQCTTSIECVDGKDAHTVNLNDACNYNCEGLLLLRCIEYPTMEDHIMHCHCPSCMIFSQVAIEVQVHALISTV